MSANRVTRRAHYRLRPTARRFWAVIFRLSAFVLLWGVLVSVMLVGPHR